MRSLIRVLFATITAGLLLSLSSGCSAKAKKARHLQRADTYFASGEYPKAEVEYLNVLQLDSRDARAMARLGAIYYEEGRSSRAYAFLSKACELAPNDLDLRLKLGTIYLSGGKAKEAREQASLVLDKMPTNAEAPVLLAESAITQTNAAETRHRLEQLSSQLGETAPLQLAFGTLDFRRGDLKAAEAAFKRAQTLDPKSGAAHYGLGNLCWAQNDPKGADLELKAAAELSPMRSIRRMRYADFKIKTGELEEGKRVLAEITKAAPDYLPAWIRQAEVALAERNYTTCASLVDQALARDAGNYEAVLLKGRLLLAQRDAPKAIAEFERMSTFYERAPQVHYYLALARLLNNDTTKALKSLNQAITLDPHFDDAILLQAQMNITRDDTASAIAALTELIRRQPRLPQAHLELAAAYQARRDLESALGAYQRLGELFPKNPETPLRTGLIYLQQNRKAEARAAFTKTLELAPNYLPAVEKLVDLDLFDQQYTTALARVEKEKAKDPNAAEPHLLLAKIHIAQAGERVKEEMKKEKEKNLTETEPHLLLARLPAALAEVDQAETILLKAMKLNPNLQEPYLLLARLYVDTRKNQKALEELNNALAKDPRDVKALMLMATIQSEAKDFSAARASYEKVLAVNPRFYLALNNLAYLYCEQFGDLDKAYDLARKARELLAYKAKPGEEVADSKARSAVDQLKAYSTDTLGWVVFKRGEYSYALSLLQESAEKLSKDPEVQSHLGMAYYMLGQEDRAQNAFKRALSSDQDFPGKAEAGRRLAVLAIDGKTADPAARASLEQQLQKRPGDPVVLSRLAAIYERDHTPEKIAKAYETALKENPKNVAVLVKLALLYSGPFHQPKRALELAKDAYKLAPEDPEISCTLGRLVFAAGDHKWALSLLEPGKQTQDPEVLYDLAIAYYSVGRVSEAEATMLSALQAGGSLSRTNEATRFLALVPLSASATKALPVEPQALEILKSNPDDVPALMIAALCAQQRGQAQAARQSYERVLNRYPGFAPAEKRLAVLYADVGDDQRAYEMAARAREALPEDTEVARTLGIALYLRARRGGASEDYRNAARLLDESVRKGTEDAQALYYLGMAHYQLSKDQKEHLKEKNETKLALQRALDLNVQTKLAEDARRVLAELN